MILSIIDIILSCLTALAIYFGVGSQIHALLTWMYCWVPIVLAAVCYFLYFVLYMGVLFIGSLFIKKNKEYQPSKFATFIIRQTSFQILFYSNCGVVAHGLEKLPKDGKYFGIFNHSSSYDAMILLTKAPAVFISKKDNIKEFVVGPWIHASGNLDIDKSDLVSSLAVIKKAGSYLKEGKANIFVAPEGTRSKTRQMLPFHAVVFEAAKVGGAPIVIFALQNARIIQDRMIFKHTKAYLDVVDVIPYEAYKDMKTQEISDMCRAKLLAFLEEHKDRLYAKDGIE